jgi:hypothetical protein
MAGVIAATPGAASAASTFASWTSSDAGSLDGVGFTVTGLSAADNGPDVQTLDLSGSDWNDAGNQQGRVFNQNTAASFTITFDSAVSNLELHLYYFRGLWDGYDSYAFSEAFSITAGLGGVSVSGNTFDSPAFFASGILSFAGPVTSLTITGTGTAIGGDAGFTMAQGAGSPAVPGIGGVAALAAVGCGRRRRR